MALTLTALRDCFDGALPSVIATCAPDGTPNAALVSQIHYINNSHVALSYHSPNTTHENILANPWATAQLIDSATGQHYQLAMRYLRTETSGPLFEQMQARLAGTASQMAGGGKLLGADIYQVVRITRVPGTSLPTQPLRCNHVAALRECLEQLSTGGTLADLFDTTLRALSTHFDIHHALVLMLDEAGQRLITVASQGYAVPGVGAEILLGEGVMGLAAQYRTVMRINHRAHADLDSSATGKDLLHSHSAQKLASAIPLAGLGESHSQLAVPIMRCNTLYGLLYVESPQEQRFSHEDEDALVTLANGLALTLALHGQGEAPHAASCSSGTHAVIRHYTVDDTIFINDVYLIKGVAGAILWKLVCEYRDHQRNEFCNRELRLDTSLGLPAVIGNLEARLILLRRRLAERCPFVTIEKTGRGRFRLRVDRPLRLSEVYAPSL